MKNIIRTLLIGIVVASLFALGACSSMGTGGGDGAVDLRGSGASFPRPVYEKWISEYGKENPKIRIDYQATGSGAGQRAILSNTVDFGASDDPMKDEDLKKAKTPLIHIPTVLGAVVMTYNIEGLEDPLKLTPEIIAGIYLGKIKKWNDESITKENPDAKLPDAEISPVFRSDASGTTAVFTDYLAKTVPEFKETIGASKQPNWVQGVGLGGQKNDGVVGQIKTAPNTIGYVELAYAKENKLPVALIKNKAGKYVTADTENVAAAAAAFADDMPEDFRIQIANADGEKAYPIASYTYLLVYQDQKDAVKGKAIVDFIKWTMKSGTDFAKALHYTPLPDNVKEKVGKKLETITFNGKPME